MSRLFVAIIVSLFTTTVVTSQPQFPDLDGGAEVINLYGPGVVLAYASNLQMDETDGKELQTLYFTADKGPSNLYTAFFARQGGEDSFWAEGVSPFHKYPIGPFLSFDVVQNNIIGLAFPNNATIPSRSVIIQSIYNGTKVTVSYTSTDVYNLVSTYISPIQTLALHNYVFFAGWNTASTSIDRAFVVVRGEVYLGDTVNPPEVVIDWFNDVLPIKMPQPCFDQFTEKSRPSMNISGQDLVLLIPGRCAIFSKIRLPPVNTYFGPTTYEVFDPTDLVTAYVSSAIFDAKYQTIYYTLKYYHSAQATLFAVNTSVSPMTQRMLEDLDVKESETILVLATETINLKDYRWLFVLASGSNKIMRMMFDGTQYINTLTAVIDPSINQISSAFYFKPWLYFTTYEPDAKLIRMIKTSFCDVWCQDSGYCSVGVCQCRNGYAVDVIHPEQGYVNIKSL
jgi:hypothetical protein